MKQVGSVEIPQEAFLARDASRITEILSRRDPAVVDVSGTVQLFLADAERKLVFSADNRAVVGEIPEHQTLRQASRTQGLVQGGIQAGQDLRLHALALFRQVPGQKLPVVLGRGKGGHGDVAQGPRLRGDGLGRAGAQGRQRQKAQDRQDFHDGAL